MNNFPYKKIIFPNGLTLLLQPMHFVHSVVVAIGVGAGPSYETRKTTGLAHFLEHMLFEGTTSLPSAKEVAHYLEKAGGKSGAWTDKEYVSYYTKVPKEHLSTAFIYLSDILFHSTLNERALEKEKGIIAEEIRRKKDNPEIEMWDAWMEWTWGKHQWLGNSTLGDEGTTQKVTRSMLQTYLKTHYYPANMAIVVTGDFHLEEALGYAKKCFGEKSKGTRSHTHTLVFTPKDVHTKVIATNTQQAKLLLGFVTGISYYHNDRFPMQVAMDVLGSGMGSRLVHKLIYELGIAYNPGVTTWNFTNTGMVFVCGGFKVDNLKKAVQTICEELERLKREKISNRELHEVKIKAISNMFFSHEGPDSIAYLYARQLITEKHIITPEEMAKKISAVSAQDIQRVARKYFIKRAFSTVVIGPIEKNQAGLIDRVIDDIIST